MGSSEVLTATIPDGSDLPVLITHFAAESILLVALHGASFQFNSALISASLGEMCGSLPPKGLTAQPLAHSRLLQCFSAFFPLVSSFYI